MCTYHVSNQQLILAANKLSQSAKARTNNILCRFLKVEIESEDKTSAGRLLQIFGAPTRNARFPHSVRVYEE